MSKNVIRRNNHINDNHRMSRAWENGKIRFLCKNNRMPCKPGAGERERSFLGKIGTPWVVFGVMTRSITPPHLSFYLAFQLLETINR